MHAHQTCFLMPQITENITKPSKLVSKGGPKIHQKSLKSHTGTFQGPSQCICDTIDCQMIPKWCPKTSKWSHFASRFLFFSHCAFLQFCDACVMATATLRFAKNVVFPEVFPLFSSSCILLFLLFWPPSATSICFHFGSSEWSESCSKLVQKKI